MTENKPIFSVKPENWEEFVTQLNKETDRGAAIVGAAFLDLLLASLVEAFLVDDRKISKKLLKNYPAPLSTFSSRIDAAYALGLISENEFHDLNLVREIRNHYAHLTKNLSFDSKEIKRIVNKLRMLNHIPKGELDITTFPTRTQFITAIAILSSFIDKRWRKQEDRRKPAPDLYIRLTDKPEF